ncbi:glycosyltransferase family 39 protein [Desulfocapsa sp. AH-315-G09]|nr:glycosyltransferase family 39 protein [Desulfocapsa sp.]MBN4065373.1 glycosyltransferase family 39 protein [Desulfocapsa sp. AH-315-G09]
MHNITPSTQKTEQLDVIEKKQSLFMLFWVAALLLALYLRMSGVFRGLGGQGYSFHPDEAKQVVALLDFLNGTYVRYYGSLFYDGYPYGLNHLDEYLLRPLFLAFGAEVPDRSFLIYYMRVLRVAYGIAIMGIAYKLVFSLTRDRKSGLLAMLFLAIAPMSVSVSHFATGDIGVDLFAALCFLFLLLYIDCKYKKIWLFSCGIAVGAAFSAKYNGLLVGMAPGILLCLELRNERDFRYFLYKCCILITGSIVGVVIFTPNLVMDFSTAISNMFASFNFIKDFQVPAEILEKPWTEQAVLGLKNNTLYIINALGCAVSLAFALGLLLTGRQCFTKYRLTQSSPDTSHNIFILSLGSFTILAFLISLCGKYEVQPFHFSYLQLPIVVIACTMLSRFYASRVRFVKGTSLVIIMAICLEFGHISWRENFFWRCEDTVFYKQYFSSSIYSPDAINKENKNGVIRSLYLEPSGTSVFKNLHHQAKGPYSDFWNTIQVAPLPQVPNPIGKNWIFLNGPTFPRNERMLFIHGSHRGISVKRFLVLPKGGEVPVLGVRSGSFATEVFINFGKATTQIKLEAHQQKIIRLEPQKWMVSGDKKNVVHIIPLEIAVPHDDVWVTVLTTEKERENYLLLGGAKDAPLTIPSKMSMELKDHYMNALEHIRYMDAAPSREIKAGERISMWELPIPAGHYKVTCEVEGLTDNASIALELVDAKGGELQLKKQSFSIKQGIQQIEYAFTKPFAPYQSHLVFNGLKGKSRVLSFKLVPDYHKISDDFDTWRTNGVRPKWITRFAE